MVGTIASSRGQAGRLLVVMAILGLSAVGCGDSSSPATADSVPATGARCADVIAAEASGDATGEYRFSVTVRSPDTGWEKYADAWEVRAPDGTVLGTRVLTHPHVDEQPFTRALGGVEIPAGVGRVEIAARDSVEGFCGETVVLEVEGNG